LVPPKPRYTVLQPSFHALVLSRCPSRPPRFLSIPSGCLLGNPGSPPAGRRPQTQAPAPTAEWLRPPLLDHPPALLGPLVRCARHGQTRNRHRVAPRRLPSLLALALPSAWRPTQDYPATAGKRIPIGALPRSMPNCRSSVSPSPSGPRPLSATHRAPWRSGAEVVGLFAESPRGARRLRFLHRAHRDVPRAVLFLCHRA